MLIIGMLAMMIPVDFRAGSTGPTSLKPR